MSQQNAPCRQLDRKERKRNAGSECETQIFLNIIVRSVISHKANGGVYFRIYRLRISIQGEENRINNIMYR